MVKNPKISKKIFFLFFSLKKICCQKKFYPLSFLILGGHNSTRALRSRTFQKYNFFKNLKNHLKKIEEKNNLPKKRRTKWYTRTRFDQNSPVQSVSDIQKYIFFFKVKKIF